MELDIVCSCLNVSIHVHPDKVSEDDVKLLHQLDSVPVQKNNFDFFNNSRLAKLSLKGIVILYDFLCFKRIVDNWHINYCAICEKETHATLTNSANHDINTSNFVLVNSFLAHGENRINLNSEPNFSPAFGIILPKILHYDVDIGSERRHQFEIAWYNNLTEIQFQIKEKCKSYLNEEKANMLEKIKQYTNEQEDNFKKLYQMTQVQKDEFFKLIDVIKQRNNFLADSDGFDKENKLLVSIENSYDHRSDNVRFVRKSSNNGDAIYQPTNQFSDGEETSVPVPNKQKSLSNRDFDGLFDIDDIDLDSADVDDKLFLIDNESNAIEKEEEHDVFPLPTSHLNSKEINLNDNIEIVNLKESSTSLKSDLNVRSRKVVSLNQNIPYHYTSKNRNNQTQQAANSLPIKIPHLRTRRVDFENDENFKIKPGESIADSIQKMARSVRNENDILDDRPRRRLNTGDLIKSRSILN